ncbi:MAG: hypothetical protein QNJ65_11265 [Xenococcaceae cyanobacterium MO_234.B1]|nr:hypothetical protein [Xenococcaceae cyanobacterium MO_234.B1]
MMKKLSYALTTLATITMTLLPATAMAVSLGEEFSPTNSTDAASQIKNAIETNGCVWVPGLGWVCN